MISVKELSLRQMKRDQGINPDIYLPAGHTAAFYDPNKCKRVQKRVFHTHTKYGDIKEYKNPPKVTEYAVNEFDYFQVKVIRRKG